MQHSVKQSFNPILSIFIVFNSKSHAKQPKRNSYMPWSSLLFCFPMHSKTEIKAVTHKCYRFRKKDLYRI
jgi:hypothetical protein